MLIAELVLLAVGVVAALAASVALGRLPGDEQAGAIALVFGLLAILVAVCLRIWWAQDRLEGRIRLMWFLPAVVALVLAPAALAADRSGRDSPLVDVLLLVAAAYGAAILGLLVLVLVLVPLELLGRGILRLLTGRPDGGWLIFGGTAIALVTTLGVVGAFALDDLPAGRRGTIPVLFALLGIPSAYTVESEGLLWVARAIALVLVALLLASAHFGERRRERSESAAAAAASLSRRRRDARRRAQLDRDRRARDLRAADDAD